MISDFIFELIFLAGYGLICWSAGIMCLWNNLQKRGLTRGDDFAYHEPSTCNRCGGSNEIRIKDTVGSTMCECETECQSCGFEDYWGYGFFQSSTAGYDFCRKYKGGGNDTRGQ